MTREELKVGQILFDEKNNSYLVYKINDAKNTVYCLNYDFATVRICLDDLRYFDVCDEIDLNLLISKLRGEQDYRTGPHTVVLDRITIDGKVYLAADKVLEIIDRSIENVEALRTERYSAVSEESKECMLLEARVIRIFVEALRGENADAIIEADRAESEEV